MSNLPYEARPLSRLALRQMAAGTRDILGLSEKPMIQMDELLDFALLRAMPDFVYAVEPRILMGDNHGLADPDDSVIVLRADVFEGAVRGKGRDRFTVSHELGHLILHQRENLVLRRGFGSPSRACHPEWQANTFAAEFLVDARQAKGCKSPGDIVRRFGVSHKTAEIQLDFLGKTGWL